MITIEGWLVDVKDAITQNGRMEFTLKDPVIIEGSVPNNKCLYTKEDLDNAYDEGWTAAQEDRY